MNVLIVAIGSRGDVQPYVALGVELQKRGHQVAIIAGSNFTNLIESFGVTAISFGLDAEELTKKVTTTLKSTIPITSALKLLDLLKGLTFDIFHNSFENLNSFTPDIVVDSVIAAHLSYTIAEYFKVPLIKTVLQPLIQTGEIPSLLVTNVNMGRYLNRRTFQLLEYLEWKATGSTINQFRQEKLNLPPLKASTYRLSYEQKTPVIGGYSPLMFPKFCDWHENIHVVGFWSLQQSISEIPKDVQEFLKQGEKPVCVNFGSMIDKDPKKLLEMCIQAARKAQRRCLVVGGWGFEADDCLDAQDDVMFVKNIPHEWLFPKVEVVIHHAGAGTTAACLKAAVPMIPVPYGFEQVLWAKKSCELGAAKKFIPRNKLSLSKLSHVIDYTVKDQSIKNRMLQLREQFVQEEGLKEFCDLLERYSETN